MRTDPNESDALELMVGGDLAFTRGRSALYSNWRARAGVSTQAVVVDPRQFLFPGQPEVAFAIE